MLENALKCQACDASQPASGGSFCVDCGIKLEPRKLPATVQEAIDFPETVPREKPRVNRTVAVIVASLLVAGTGIAAYLFVPRAVVLEIEVNDVYGGVFDAACQPTDDGRRVLPATVDVADESGDVLAGVDIQYDQFTGSCGGRAEFSLPPLGEYRVLDGSEVIALIETDEVFSGRDSGSVDAAVYKSISGTFDLNDEFDRCNSDNYCWWGWYFGIDLPRNDTTDCQGDNGYSDIYPGTIVTVFGNSNGEFAFSSLGFGTEIWPEAGDLTLTCTFEWSSVSLPYDSQGYSVEVSSRGAVSFSLDEIEYNNGVVSTRLGTP